MQTQWHWITRILVEWTNYYLLSISNWVTCLFYRITERRLLKQFMIKFYDKNFKDNWKCRGPVLDFLKATLATNGNTWSLVGKGQNGSWTRLACIEDRPVLFLLLIYFQDLHSTYDEWEMLLSADATSYDVFQNTTCKFLKTFWDDQKARRELLDTCHVHIYVQKLYL